MLVRELKLFVWENVLYSYTPGLAVALAHDVDEARRLLEEKMGCSPADIAGEPDVYDTPVAVYVYGGG